MSSTPTVDVSLLISKALGYGIVMGALIIKVPQIQKILSTRKVAGLNIYMFLLELIGFTINLFYNYRLNAPLSTYGENAFMLIQNLIILFLFFQFEVGFGPFFIIVTSAYSAFFYAILHENIIDSQLLFYLSIASIPIFSISKIPQIITNFKHKSTGQLSAVTVFLQFAGTAARLFTTLKEVDDKVVLIGFLIGFFFNTVMLLQMIIYWKNQPESTQPAETKQQPAKQAKKKKTAKAD